VGFCRGAASAVLTGEILTRFGFFTIQCVLRSLCAWIFACGGGNAGDHSIMKRLSLLALMGALLLCVRLYGAQAPDAILLTIFLKHDQSLNLAEIQKVLEDQGFWKAFPPEGTTVVS
jgi:hypothetical protein